jgi:uncharacterized membrane protein
VADDSTRSELRAGVAETSRYLLSHHTPGGYHRCYALRIRGRTVRLCARCLGIYPGIVVGLGMFVFGVAESLQLLLVATLPMPALVDWAVTHLRAPDGHNLVRTGTGTLLGVGYGLGFAQLVVGGEVLALGIGLLYGIAGALVLLVHDESPW